MRSQPRPRLPKPLASSRFYESISQVLRGLEPEQALQALVESTLPVPSRRQQTAYTCGVASLQAALEHFGIEPPSEERFAELLGTTHEQGTSISAMAQAAQALGLQASIHQGLTLDDLAHLTSQGVLPIVAYQAWPEASQKASEAWKNSDDNGHYSIVRGVDEDRVTFMDPAVSRGGHRQLDQDEFLKVWHDIDSSSKPPKRLVRAALLLSV